MKKSITSKLIFGIIALVVIVGAGFLIFGKHSNANLGASVYGITKPTPASSALPVVNVGTSPTPRQICIRSGRFMSAPSITVTSPNGGEVYQPGQQITITWTSCNLPSNVQIGGGLIWPTGFSSNPSPSAFINYTNTGSLTYTLPGTSSFNSPNTFQYGNFYKISLGATDAITHSVIATDNSNNFFSIIQTPLSISSNGTPTAVVAAAGGTSTHSVVTFTIPFTVTANSNLPVYIPSNAGESATATALHAIEYAVDNSGTFTLNGTGTIAYTGNGALTPDTNGNYVIPAGQTKTFNLVATYQPSVAGSYRASLVNVNWNTNDSASVYNTYTLGLSASAYKTPYVVAQ